MKTSFTQSSEHRTGFWDAAAGGVFPGLLGGIAMLVFLIAGGFLTGHTPAKVLGDFDTTSGIPLLGALIHLSVSCVYGTLFALLAYGLVSRFHHSWSMVSAALLGLFYGLILWLIAVTLLKQAAASLITTTPPAVFLLAHLVYGLILGVETKRQVASLSLKPNSGSGG